MRALFTKILASDDAFHIPHLTKHNTTLPRRLRIEEIPKPGFGGRRKVCMIHPQSRLCLGCNRTTDEIALWSKMTAEERAEITAALPGRNPSPGRRSGGAGARRAARGARTDADSLKS